MVEVDGLLGLPEGVGDVGHKGVLQELRDRGAFAGVDLEALREEVLGDWRDCALRDRRAPTGSWQSGTSQSSGCRRARARGAFP